MFEGFAKDLAEAMASRLRTKYRIREVATFGEKHKDTNQWDGLIGELVNRVSSELSFEGVCAGKGQDYNLID